MSIVLRNTAVLRNVDLKSMCRIEYKWASACCPLRKNPEQTVQTPLCHTAV